MSNDNDIHRELSTMLDDLTSRLSDIEKDINLRETQTSSDTSKHEENIDNDLLSAALEGESFETIANIKNTLNMIGEGSYGYCADCGHEIAEERMQSTPYTDKCSDCAYL